MAGNSVRFRSAFNSRALRLVRRVHCYNIERAALNFTLQIAQVGVYDRKAVFEFVFGYGKLCLPARFGAYFDGCYFTALFFAPEKRNYTAARAEVAADGFFGGSGKISEQNGVRAEAVPL